MLQRKIDSFPKRVVEHTYVGHSLKISLQDYVAEEWYDKLYETERMPEIEYLQNGQLKPGARVFDLGAHQGVIAMILARLVGDTGSVVAVEGTKHNAEVAQENVRLNGITNMTVKHAVAAEQAGLKMKFSATLNGAVGDNLLPVEVTSISIDSLAEEFGLPNIVFVDVEGYECQVLDGGKKSAGRRRRFLRRGSRRHRSGATWLRAESADLFSGDEVQALLVSFGKCRVPAADRSRQRTQRTFLPRRLRAIIKQASRRRCESPQMVGGTGFEPVTSTVSV